MLHFLIEITTFLTALFSFSLGLFTITRNYKYKVNFLWFLYTMAVTVWCVGYLLAINAPNNYYAFIYIRILYIGAALIPIIFFHFISVFLFKNIKYKLFINFGYAASLVFLFLIEKTNFIISGTRYMEDFGHFEKVEVVGFYF